MPLFNRIVCIWVVFLFHICTLCLVLTLCFEELGAETIATLQYTKTDTGGSTGIIDIALPMGSYDDTAYTVTVIITATRIRNNFFILIAFRSLSPPECQRCVSGPSQPMFRAAQIPMNTPQTAHAH